VLLGTQLCVCSWFDVELVSVDGSSGRSQSESKLFVVGLGGLCLQ
jgi:hypothetical protein